MKRLSLFVCGLLVATPLSLLTATDSAQAGKCGSLKVSRKTASAGQTLVFSGSVKGSGRASLERLTMGRGPQEIKTFKVKANGKFKIRQKMYAMNPETFQVTRGGCTTRSVVITNVEQNVTLSLPSSTPDPDENFQVTAQVAPAKAGRSVELQRQVSPTTWTTVATATTKASGQATFTISLGSPSAATLRAVADPHDQLASKSSRSYDVEVPELDETTDPNSPKPSSKVWKNQPSSAYSAARKYEWWNTGVESWDWEVGQPMKPWTDWRTGSARNHIWIGMLRQESGDFGPRAVNHGSMSTTLKAKSKAHARGRWESRIKAQEAGTTYNPYTIRFSLVPFGTKDGVTPADSIVIGEWTTYSKKTTIGLNNSTKGSFKGINNDLHRNTTNWNVYAVEILDNKVTWVLNSTVAGSLKIKLDKSIKWTPRFEMIGTDGLRMTRTHMGADWVRYYPLDDPNAIALPAGTTLAASDDPV